MKDLAERLRARAGRLHAKASLLAEAAGVIEGLMVDLDRSERLRSVDQQELEANREALRAKGVVL